jgi:hypothetical protein
VICSNNWVWQEKFLLDFGDPGYLFVDNWKTLYKNYGSVYSFGDNVYCQLGLGDYQDRFVPTKNT